MAVSVIFKKETKIMALLLLLLLILSCIVSTELCLGMCGTVMEQQPSDRRGRRTNG